MSKKIIILIIIPFFLLSCSQKKDKKTNTHNIITNKPIDEKVIENQQIPSNSEVYKSSYYIIAPNGLSLRSKPSLDSERIELIPFGTKIMTSLKTKESEKIYAQELLADMKDYWYYTDYNNKSGWVFGGYISFLNLTKEQVIIGQFINKPFKDIPRIISINNYDVSDIIVNDKISQNFTKYFGNQNNLTKEKIPNKHNSQQIDEKVTISFESMNLFVYIVPKRQMIIGLEITNNHLNLSNEISFGMKREDIIKIFGNPQEEKTNQLKYIYSKELGVTHNIYFHLDNNSLNKITIWYYFD